jgi:hypothetical protein
MRSTRCLSLAIVVAALWANPASPDDCDNVFKFLNPNRAGNPAHLRWQQGAQIPLGCTNCTETQNGHIEDGADRWNDISGGKYSFGSGTNIAWKTTTWTSSHDLMLTTVTPPTLGAPYITEGVVEMDGTRSDWWFGISCDGIGDGFDFQSAIVHEVGHVLGLADVICSGAAMHEELNEGECTFRRWLSTEDETAIEYLYCTESQLAAAGNPGVYASDACTPDDPVARVGPLNYVKGRAFWVTLEEEGTSHYVIEGCRTPNGQGLIDLVEDPAGIGLHSVPVDPRGNPLLRLVEVEETGKRVVRGITSRQPGGTTSPIPSPSSGRLPRGALCPPASALCAGAPGGSTTSFATHATFRSL